MSLSNQLHRLGLACLLTFAAGLDACSGSSGGVSGPSAGGLGSGGAAGANTPVGGSGAGAGTLGGGGAVPGSTGAGGGGATTGAAGTNPGGAGRAGSGNAGAPAGTGGAGTSGAPGSSGSAGAGPADHTPASVCARWNADRADMSEGTWSGNIAGCVAGDISAIGRANALKLFNLYRWLADLPEVQTEASRDAQAQACSLLQDANWRQSGLSHTPPMTWTCWTQLGADGSSSSNISGGPGVSSVDSYLIDTGNETTFGHRRIILSNELGPIGLGSTGPGGSSCMQNLRGTGAAGKAWMAWPPAGVFPIQAYAPRARTTLASTGWSVQSRSIQLAAATVTVTSAGMNLPVTVTPLTGNYGNNNAIRIVPNGWDAMAGQTYAVAVSGISTPINYSVQIVDCAN